MEQWFSPDGHIQFDSLLVPRLTKPLVAQYGADITLQESPWEIVEIPVVHHAGPYHVADPQELGEYHVYDIRHTPGRVYRTTDLELAKIVADSFHKAGL
jgi:hypothetical protein